LVLSTIHTNDAVGTIPRLVDMGVEPYLIPPVLVCSIAQRLTRTLCPETGKETPLSPSDRKSIELDLATLPKEHRFKIQDHAYEPERTPACPTGLRGRMAVFEVLEMSGTIEKIILTNPVESQVWTAARAEGMLTMREDAIMKAFARQIPFSEVNTLSPLMLAAEEEPPETVPAAEAAGEAETEGAADEEGGVTPPDAVPPIAKDL
jgi:type IV pilus assembly protein PilB